jgi:hypothetical protein
VIKNSKIRIVYRPLLTGPDGQVLRASEIEFAQFLIDPLKYNPEGVKEAAHYSNPQWLHISGMIGKPEVMAQLLTTVGRAQYKEEVQPFIGKPEFDEKAVAFLDDQWSRAVTSPEIIFRSVDRTRKRAAKHDAAIVIEPHLSPEQAKPYLIMKADTGYADNADFVTEASDTKRDIRKLIDGLPDYLRSSPSRI